MGKLNKNTECVIYDKGFGFKKYNDNTITYVSEKSKATRYLTVEEAKKYLENDDEKVIMF